MYIYIYICIYPSLYNISLSLSIYLSLSLYIYIYIYMYNFLGDMAGWSGGLLAGRSPLLPACLLGSLGERPTSRLMIILYYSAL